MPGYLVPTNTVDQSTTIGGYNVLNAVNAGAVLQVVQNRITTIQTTTSQVEQIGNQCSITPSSSTSKILVWAYAPVRVWGAQINPWMGVSLYRGSTRILQDGRNASDTYAAGIGIHVGTATGTTNYHGGHSNLMILDSPNTTGLITYYAKFSAYQPTLTAAYPHTEGNNASDSGAVMILTEIAG